MKSSKTYRQYDAMDCGPTCLRMVARHHGRSYTMETLRNRSGINREGVSLLGISEAAEDIGLRTIGAKLTWEQLSRQVPLPRIVYWRQVHLWWSTDQSKEEKTVHGQNSGHFSSPGGKQ